MKLVLGSASAQRKKILARMGYSFDVVPADIDERSIRREDPKELTMMLAKAKAEAIRAKLVEPAILLTADQVVLCNSRILEKPADARQAQEFLQGYTGHAAQPINAIVVTNTETGKQAAENDTNTVYFRPFTEEVILQLIVEGNVFLWAGAFCLEDPLIQPFVDRIEGSLDSIEGLPVELTRRLIAAVSS